MHETARVRPRLEVPIFGPEDGQLAASLGVSRLELNHAGSYVLGGLTPALAELSALLSSFTHTCSPNSRPPIRIMIRPRGPRKCPSSATPNRAPQDFIYTPDELSVMASSIGEFASSGLLSPRHGDGFVFGILKQDSVTGRLELDLERNRELVALATTSGREEGFRFKCVLHRAVDDLLTSAGTGAEVRKVMEEVKRCGFDGLLTSGGRGGAVNNVRRLKMVVDVAEEDGVEVIVGGGVRSGNLGGLAGGLSKDDGLWEGVWFHSSCLRHEGMFDEQEAEGLAEQIRNMKCCLP